MRKIEKKYIKGLLMRRIEEIERKIHIESSIKDIETEYQAELIREWNTELIFVKTIFAKWDKRNDK